MDNDSHPQPALGALPFTPVSLSYVPAQRQKRVLEPAKICWHLQSQPRSETKKHLPNVKNSVTGGDPEGNQ